MPSETRQAPERSLLLRAESLLHTDNSVAEIADERDASGRTALHLAASAGRIELVEALIRARVDLDTRDRGHPDPKQFARHFREFGPEFHAVRIRSQTILAGYTPLMNARRGLPSGFVIASLPGP